MSFQTVSDVVKNVLLLLFVVSGVSATIAFLYRKGKAMTNSLRRPKKTRVDTLESDREEGSGRAA